MYPLLPLLLAASPHHRVVVEVNTGGQASYRAALGNVENLKKALAPEPCQVEIVCLGPGIDMLFNKKNPLANRLTKSHASGVKFAICGNSMRSRQVPLSSVFPFVKVVKAGVAEIVQKEEAGWSYLKTGP